MESKVKEMKTRGTVKTQVFVSFVREKQLILLLKKGVVTTGINGLFYICGAVVAVVCTAAG